MIITIDGPSGTGKTTVARDLANRLNFTYFDTGAMYRAFTWLMLERHIDISDLAAIQNCLKEFDYKIVENQAEKRYFVGQKDVTQAIRSQAVTQFVSEVSALRQVRAFLLEFQYRFSENQNAVFEGRDLGTVVFPNADLKIFLDANPQARAKRRMQELLLKQPQEFKGLSKEQMLADIMRRDAYDSSRELAPLKCPSDALKIDTTDLSIDQVVDRIVNYYFERFPGADSL